MVSSGPNQLSYSGTLSGATDNRSATCGGAGPDLFLSFDVTTASEVRFSITSIGGSATPVGYVTSSTCGTEFACQTGTSTSAPTLLAPGTYRLVVDSLSSGVSGAFTATVTLSAPASLAGDTCATAEALTLSGGSALVSGTTSSYADDHSSATCSDVGGDRYYRLTLPSAVNLTAVVSPSLSAVAGLYLLGPSSACSGAAESRCLTGSTPGNSTTLAASSLQAGTYYLVVKNLSTADGSFTLSVSTTAATVPGDTCSAALPLSFSSGATTASGTLSGASNDRASSCASSGADVVYSFTATAGQVLTATVSPGSSWRPLLTLTSGSSCSAASETTCNAATSTGGSATFTSAPLAAGIHYLWVDSVSGIGSPGAFTLSASLSTAAGNGETCAGPTPLSFFGGTATASDTTLGMTNDNSSSCTTSSGPDRVYSFTAAAGQTLTASLTPSGWRGHLVLQGPNSSCSNMPEVACQLGSAAGSTVSLTASSLVAGTYFLWVDGVSGSAGSFSLSATLSSGTTPTGESCADPLPLTFSSSGSVVTPGNTLTAANDTSGSCGGTGPDRVYALTVVGTRTLSASVTGSTGFRPIVYVRSSCTSTSNLVCTVASTAGGTATLSTTLTSGTYFLWVDGLSSTSGLYTLSATLN